jgi:hypothetical protein
MPREGTLPDQSQLQKVQAREFPAVAAARKAGISGNLVQSIKGD